MPTYGEFGRDYRAVTKLVHPGSYVYITAAHEGRTFKVFQVSIWDDEIDGDLEGVLPIPSRLFKDNTVFFLNVARDVMVNLRISARGGTSYLVEPRPAAQRLVAARLGLTVDDYEALVLRGGLRDLILHDVEQIRRRYRRRLKAAVTENTTISRRATDLGMEKARLEKEISELMGKLGVTHDDLFVSRNILNEREAENRRLREFIVEHGLTPPDLRPRPLWNPG